MSLCLCQDCGSIVDSDAEPECFYTIDEDCNETENDYPLCNSCRDGSY